MRAVLDPQADRKRAAQMGNVDSDKSYVRYVLADAHVRARTARACFKKIQN